VEAQFEQWAVSAGPYFQRSLGLTSAFAVPAARLYIALWAAGLNPRISRGWSDPSHQAALRAAWDRGDRSGLRVRPADPANSLHCKSTFLGSPDAKAVDMPCSDDAKGASIARSLGIGAGIAFSTPDPGHYYLLGG